MSGKRNAYFKHSYVDENSSDDEENMEVENRISSGGTSSGSRSSETSREQNRRGRGMAKRPCLNKNALMARENRQRKKEYVENLENKLSLYEEENKKLKDMMNQQHTKLKAIVSKQNIKVTQLAGQVSYFKSVLKNKSMLMPILNSINEGLRSRRIIADDTDCSRSSCTENVTDHTYMTSVSSIDENEKKYAILGDNNNGMYGRQDGAFTQVTTGVDDFISGGELAELPSLDLLDSFSNIEDLDSPPRLDYLDDTAEDCNDFGNLYENFNKGLENNGICLHINSGKISLEFCSVCSLNSINSDE